MSEAAADSTPTPLEQLELRLAELELKIGTSVVSSSSQTQNIDVTSRLDNLLRIETSRRPPAPPTAKASDASLHTKRAALHQEFRTIDRLLSELAMSPLAGPAASVGGNANAPLLFRRQEILASSDSMKRDMEVLSRIRELTMIGSESNVVNCPIIASERYNLPSDPEAKERLERLCFRAAEVHKRSTAVSIRADRMLDSYGKVMMALSEKMVLAEEQIKG
ncbi:hypothetical protein QTG54_007303 [Skeletonema marinoi]|uniref:Uncharacterized protein n=1 Tax=Skeletonema marinoi TaxID=267567 RepID=A0AAD8Y9Y3_9STRA|nr:hypothetical protein QTG54_007303 [Skeletonema marinoi]